MTYEDMIKTECTDERYEEWADYRNALTDYIIRDIKHFYIKEKLKTEGLRRLPAAYDSEKLLSEQTSKPTVAIWGAGGGNDMDLPRLAKYFKLVLIDHNNEQLQKTCVRFGLTDEQCICVDLQFWDITEDDYKMLEAMLKDGLADAEIISYMNEIVMRMQNHEYVKLPKFDFSVCVGLASQLNARLGMLFTMYERGIGMADYLCELNDIAVNKLADTIHVMTKKAVLFGYEVTALKNTETMLADLLTYEPEEWTKMDTWPPHDLTTDISGNEVLSAWIHEQINMEEMIPYNYETHIWPFASRKYYVMLFGFFSKVTIVR